MATINIRVSDDVKEESKEVFESLGLDLSTGIKIYLKQVIARNGIPFELSVSNLDIATNELKQGKGKSYSDVSSLMKDLEADD